MKIIKVLVDEMPSGCKRCDFCVAKMYCLLLEDRKTTVPDEPYKRRTDCPLVYDFGDRETNALNKRIAELREDNASLGDSNAWIKQNYEDLERDYGVMYDKMCARIDKVTAENKVLEDACEILRKQNKRLFSQVFSNAYGKEREE